MSDIVEASERVRAVMGDMTLEAFEADWQTQWIVERSVEIISEASLHLPPALKSRHSAIDWRSIAGIGNELRHEYSSIAADVMWKIVRNNLTGLETACRHELPLALSRDGL